MTTTAPRCRACNQILADAVPGFGKMSDALPLYLTLDESRVLLTAVEILLQMDGAALADPELRGLAERQVREKEGAGGVARIDQAMASARSRLPVLHHLHGVLVEHTKALEKEAP